MLPKKRRVTRKLFDDMAKKSNPRAFSEGFFSVRYFKNKEMSPSRVSVAVSKKVSKLAVKRNLIKRRINSVLEKMINDIEDSYAIILFPKKGVESLSFLDLEKEMEKVLNKINVLKR